MPSNSTDNSPLGITSLPGNPHTPPDAPTTSPEAASVPRQAPLTECSDGLEVPHFQLPTSSREDSGMVESVPTDIVQNVMEDNSNMVEPVPPDIVQNVMEDNSNMVEPVPANIVQNVMEDEKESNLATQAVVPDGGVKHAKEDCTPSVEAA